MPPTRLLEDYGLDGRISVSAGLDGELARARAWAPFELSWPLDANALEDLRWYLEDYLRAPYGVYGDEASGWRGGCGGKARRSSGRCSARVPLPPSAACPGT